MRTNASAAWTAMLEQIEIDVTAAETALAAGELPSGAPWHPAKPPEPLPEALVQRARGLITRIADVQQRADARARQLQQELDDLQHRRAAAIAYRGTSAPGTTDAIRKS